VTPEEKRKECCSGRVFAYPCGDLFSKAKKEKNGQEGYENEIQERYFFQE